MKKRAVKIITIFVILSVVISCCSFSVSASSYDPDYSFDNWYSSGTDIYDYVYPSHDRFADSDCFNHSELNGLKYFMPSVDSAVEDTVLKPALFLPPLPSSGLLDYTFVFSDNFGNYWFLTFSFILSREDLETLGTNIYVSLDQDYFNIYNSDHFSFSEVVLYYYNDVSKQWVYGTELSFDDCFLNLEPHMFSGLFYWYNFDFNYETVSSDGTSSVVYKNALSVALEDYPDAFTPQIAYLYKFSVNLDFNFSEVNVSNVYNMIFSDLGFINYLNMSYMYLSFEIFTDSSSSGYVNLYHYNELESQSYISSNTVVFSDFDFGKYSVSSAPDTDLTFSFIIASDSPILFFPGTLDFISQGNYIAQKNHNETLDAIKESSADIVEAIQNSNYDLVYGDTGVPYVEPVDTSPVDDYVNSEQAIMGDVYELLDDQIVNKLPPGSADVDSYLKDSVNSFVNNMGASIRSISSLFDKVVEASAIMPLMLFVLSFGFAIFMLGRRLS